MRILHTGDWHLGQKFLNQERIAEQRQVLAQLLEYIDSQNVDVLIIAGDVFDQRNPSLSARQLYYEVLMQLSQSNCQHIVIIGGNHDSPGLLNTTREFLMPHNIYLVGGATEALEDEIIELKDEAGVLQAVVAAVPFLHDRDLRKGVVGESGDERVQRIQKGLVKHYEELAVLCKKYEKLKIPILATGHLFAKGANGSEEQANIYLGDRENIGAEHFPKIFKYIALGHLHRAQLVGKKEHIRYSGAPIPLSFKEYDYQHGCWLVEFEKEKLKDVDFLQLKAPRRLLRFAGKLEAVKKELVAKGKKLLKEPLAFPAWVEIQIELEAFFPNLNQEVHEWAAPYPMEIVMCRVHGLRSNKVQDEKSDPLEHMQPLDIFRKKCTQEKMEPDTQKQLEQSFIELMNWMEERTEISA